MGSRLRDLRFSPNGAFLVSVSEEGWVRRWMLSGEATLTQRGTMARWSADGRFLAISGGGYDAVTLWNRRGEFVTSIDPSDYNYSGVRFSPHSALMSVSSGDNVTVWEF
ncbi:WD40 repeat domain-containing protein [Baaleninema simplex]|uniref:WD40 repeat domain-containing protein n=1 Tax=Baaleninema simplex TaxID=2862350 RepID=UPI0003488037|nr:WD40 repeat domain-containing protein [Baaleninema simplex]